MDNSAATSLYDLLVTRDFEPEILDAQGKPVTDPTEAELFSFDYKTENKNYGTVVVLLGAENDLEVYFGDNLGRTMDSDDKQGWYDFLAQMKAFATRNMLKFNLQNLNRLKYTMKGMAAIKEGLFEGYYGTRKTSYQDQPKATRLVIKHSRPLGEGEARFRHVESLFVETDQGERFRLPFTKLVGGRAMARHCAEGGNPYDAFGQHISQIVSEMNTLSKFVRAARNREFQGPAGEMVEAAVRHYTDLKAKAKHMISRRGYLEARDAFDPAEVTETEHMVDEIRTMFIEQNLDRRIEEALPILARLAAPVVAGSIGKENEMKEINEFENWADTVTEGTWSLPETPADLEKLQTLMANELIVGPDATNATEQLYDLVGDDVLFDILDELSLRDPDANAWDDPRVMARINELVPGLEQKAAEPTDEALQGAPTGGAMQMKLAEAAGRYEPADIGNKLPDEGSIHSIPGHLNTDMLPGFQDNSTDEDYSDSFYYTDPISKGVFVVYSHGGMPRVRGTDGMDEQRVAEIAKSLSRGGIGEDLDTDGVMMTRPSNMSSESAEREVLNRLIELARV